MARQVGSIEAEMQLAGGLFSLAELASVFDEDQLAKFKGTQEAAREQARGGARAGPRAPR